MLALIKMAMLCATVNDLAQGGAIAADLFVCLVCATYCEFIYCCVCVVLHCQPLC